jgi:protein disulfide-isomerase
MRNFIATCLILISVGVSAAPAPYDESADAKADIRAALVDTQQTKVPVLVVFGANWCGDCKMLDTAFKTGAAAPLIAKNFKVVKVNVGRFDHNVDVADSYGVPLKKGIPAVAVLSVQGKVTYVTQSGELADARAMGEDGVYQFFSKLSAPAL